MSRPEVFSIGPDLIKEPIETHEHVFFINFFFFPNERVSIKTTHMKVVFFLFFLRFWTKIHISLNHEIFIHHGVFIFTEFEVGDLKHTISKDPKTRD